MKVSKNICAVLALSLAVSLGACNKGAEQQTEQTVGEATDSMIEETTKTVEESKETVVEHTTDAVNVAKEAVGDAAETAKDGMDKADAELEEFPQE